MRTWCIRAMRRKWCFNYRKDDLTWNSTNETSSGNQNFNAAELYRACKETVSLLGMVKCQTQHIQDRANQHTARLLSLVNEIEKHELDDKGNPIHVSDGQWKKHSFREGCQQSNCARCGEIISRPSQAKGVKTKQVTP